MEYFSNIYIHRQIFDRLTKSIINERLAHSYLFYGSEGTAKETVAIEFAKALNCTNSMSRPCNECSSCIKISNLNHPDVQFIFPTNNNWTSEDIASRLKRKAINPYSRIDLAGSTTIQIDRIRELKNQAKYAPYEASKRLIIISDADKMSRESANAFLKLLEEPPQSMIIILITTEINSLLDTIRSRCQKIYFPYLKFTEALSVVQKYHEVDPTLEKIVRISNANLKMVFDNIDREVDEKRSQVYEYLRAIASGNPYLLSESVDIMAHARDKNYLMEVLNLITLWFRDAVHLINFGSDADLINVDFQREMSNFVKAYARSNFEMIFNDIENAILNVQRNIYSPLLLTVLGIRIKKNLFRS